MNKKLVAVINKDLNSGVAMNALAHAAFSLGSQLDQAEAFLHLNSDASGNHWAMSGMPFIILRANALQIKKTFLQAKAANITHVAFVDSMTGGDYIEQIEKISQKGEEDHCYYAVILWGEVSALNALTKKFSIYR